jgi:hypothetical protein
MDPETGTCLYRLSGHEKDIQVMTVAMVPAPSALASGDHIRRFQNHVPLARLMSAFPSQDLACFHSSSLGKTLLFSGADDSVSGGEQQTPQDSSYPRREGPYQTI